MRSFTVTFRVRAYEMDALGHVNNAVYLHYVEEAAIRHADAVGLGLATMRELGGMWVVRRHTITYHRPAVGGDDLTVTTTVTAMVRVRAQRHTTIKHATAGHLVAECDTEWVWVGPEGRPKAVPAEMLAIFAEGEEGRPAP